MGRIDHRGDLVRLQPLREPLGTAESADPDLADGQARPRDTTRQRRDHRYVLRMQSRGQIPRLTGASEDQNGHSLTVDLEGEGYPVSESGTPLRRGWTTGACATAATKAAYAALLTGAFPDPVTIRLPGGQEPAFALAVERRGDARSPPPPA